MSLNPACWPDPGAMVEELRGLGIETMVTHWPFMSTDSVHRAEYEAAGALAINATSGTADTFWAFMQEGALITTLSEATRNLTMRKWVEGYGRFGVRAMWLDEMEPDRTAYSNELCARGGWEYEGTPVAEVGPTWRQQWIATMAQTLRDLYGEGNYFLLSRSAWLGTAKLGHSVWSGDTNSSWASLQQQVSTGLGAGLSGIGMWTSDLGGYFATMHPFDPELEELLVRWAQFSSVSPLMRLHGHRLGGPPADPVCMQTNGDNGAWRVCVCVCMCACARAYVWHCTPPPLCMCVCARVCVDISSFPPPPPPPLAEPWTLFKDATASGANYNAFVAAIQWREQRRNYIMDIQAEHSRTAAPLIAPVWLLFPGEAACAFDASGGDNVGCAGAFMLGPDWLAKPVTAYGQKSSWVWLPRLPAGQAWVYHFSQANFGQGGNNVTIPTPISEFPLFYRQRAEA